MFHTVVNKSMKTENSKSVNSTYIVIVRVFTDHDHPVFIGPLETCVVYSGHIIGTCTAVGLGKGPGGIPRPSPPS